MDKLELYAVGWFKHGAVQHLVVGPSLDRDAMVAECYTRNLNAVHQGFVLVKLTLPLNSLEVIR